MLPSLRHHVYKVFTVYTLLIYIITFALHQKKNRLLGINTKYPCTLGMRSIHASNSTVPYDAHHDYWLKILTSSEPRWLLNSQQNQHGLSTVLNIISNMKNIHNSMIIDKFRDEKSNGIFFLLCVWWKSNGIWLSKMHNLQHKFGVSISFRTCI